ncbi:hypothetical protein PQX77_006149 [Marasmius sp. AFHP31]|nr:hypothetical protein PQX77_006149 [Marasmius sp. AFHP31]
MNLEAYTGQEDTIELSKHLGSIFNLHRKREIELGERDAKIAALNDQLEDSEKRAKRAIELEREIEFLKAQHSSEIAALQAKLAKMQRKHEDDLKAAKESASETARNVFKSRAKALWESYGVEESHVEDQVPGQNSRNRKRNTLYSEYDLHDTKLKSLNAFVASNTSPTIAGEETPVGFARHAMCGYPG